MERLINILLAIGIIAICVMLVTVAVACVYALAKWMM